MRRLLPNQEFYFAFILCMGGAMNRYGVELVGGSHGLPLCLAQPIRGIESARTICGVCRDFYSCIGFRNNHRKPDCEPPLGDFCEQHVKHVPVF